MNRDPAATPHSRALRELAVLFLKLGTTAFGGPAAHVAMMEDEVVQRRQWLSRARFLDLLGATNVIPGPNSTEMAIHVGYLRAGWSGLVVAGICFILPAALLVGGIAAAYVRFGTLPQVAGALYGVKPVVIAIVAQALWRLAGTAIKSTELALVGAIAIVLAALGINELLVLAAAGLAVAAGHLVRSRPSKAATLLSLTTWNPAGLLPNAAVTAAAATPFGLWPLFWFFAKVGAVLFGSGYVLLAFLRADLVEHWHWLTEAQLLDAVAVGQVTPGPVFTTATFVGYILGGPLGGLIATVGIFLPAFFFVAASGPLVPRLRRSRTAGAVLDGINVGALALMAVVTWQLGRAAIVDLSSAFVAVLSMALLARFRLNSAWLVLAGAATGMLVTAH